MKSLVRFSYIIFLNLIIAPVITRFIGFTDDKPISYIMAVLVISFVTALINGALLNWAFKKYDSLQIDSKVVSAEELTKMLDDEMKRRVDKMEKDNES